MATLRHSSGIMSFMLLFLSSFAWGADFSTVIVPPSAADAEADTHLVFPWDCAVSVASMRQQQVYLGTTIGTGEIIEIRFRQDSELGIAFGPVQLSNTTIRLASTDRSIDQLSLVFDDNLGDDAQVVFQGALSLSSVMSLESPRPFDVIVPLQTGFGFAGAADRHLVLDVTLPVCAQTTALDASLVLDDEVARIWETDSTASVATRADSVGLVTELVLQFIFDEGFETGDLSRWSFAFP